MSEAAYNFHLTNPSFWYQKSVSLYASAAIIWEARHGKRDQEFISSLGLKGEFCVDIGCEHPYLMTMGLSYEVILKAICITENKDFPKNHDLQSLANLVDIKFTNTEKDQFLLLSEFITWEGRYPVPKKHQKLTQHWNATRKRLWKTENILAWEVTSRTDIFEHDSLKTLWLKLQDKYWDNRHITSASNGTKTVG
jgi:hypothetical protein